MKARKLAISGALAIVCAAAFTNCAPFNPGLTDGSSNLVFSNGAHALPVDGSEAYVVPIATGCNGNVNQLCASVTFCKPGSSSCVTVDNLLVDTGSYGLRVFSTAVSSLGLSQFVDASGHALAECMPYSGGSSDWGPVARADVRLGGRTASNIPIQLIDAGFAARPTSCTNPDTSPADVGFNGIIGIGALVSDAGLVPYYNCNSSSTSCSQVSISAGDAVANPVAAMPQDNNGLALQLPIIPDAGAVVVNGYMIMGIGTQAHNTPPSGVVSIPLSRVGHFQTEFAGKTWGAYLDTGTATLLLPASDGLPTCSANALLLCPTSLTTLTSVLVGALGAPRLQGSFAIGNAQDMLARSNPNLTFNSLGSTSGLVVAQMQSELAYGLPYYFGKTIYVGFTGKSSSLGAGPIDAY